MPQQREESEFPRTLGKVATSALSLHRFTRYDQLTGVSESELLEIHGVGPKAVTILRTELLARGLSFRE
jgi:hypothetical protein